MRLVLIGREIAQGKGIQIRRPDAQELLKIRKGQVSLQELFDESDAILSEMKMLFQNSNLPEEVSQDFIHNLLVEFRKEFYESHSNIINYVGYNELHESQNPFIIKTYDGKSELHYFIIKTLVDKVMDSWGGDFETFENNAKESVVMSCFTTDFWPITNNSETGAIEKVSTENFSIIEITRDKISVMAGGDWQDPIKFDIVLWQDVLVPINIKYVGALCWEEGIGKEEFFKKIDFK